MLSLGSNISATQAVESKYSIDFDGSNDYVEFRDCGAVKSMSMWFSPDTSFNSSSTVKRLCGFRGTLTESADYFGISLGSSTGNLTGEVLCVLPDGASRTGTTRTFTAGEWYHLVISWNASNNYFDIYVNGVAETDLVHSTHTLADWTNFRLARVGQNSSQFAGKITEVALWDVTLDSNAVTALYNNGSPVNPTVDRGDYDNSSSLLRYWKCGNGILDDIDNGMSTSWEQGIIVDQSGTVGIDADQSVAINTTNWEVSSDNFNGQTPIGNGVITVDGTQTGFSIIRPKSGVWNKTVATQFYRVELHYTRSAGTLQFKATGYESTESGISVSAGSDTSVQQLAIGYIRANGTDWGLTFNSTFVGTVTKVVLQKVTPNTSGIVKNGATKSSSTP